MSTWKTCWLVSCNDLFDTLYLISFLKLVKYAMYANCCILWQDYDTLFSSTQATIHSKLVDFQKDLVNIQVLLYLHVPFLAILRWNKTIIMICMHFDSDQGILICPWTLYWHRLFNFVSNACYQKDTVPVILMFLDVCAGDWGWS